MKTIKNFYSRIINSSLKNNHIFLEADASYLSGKYIKITCINCELLLLLLLLLLLTTNTNKVSIYCELRGKIFIILNKFLNEFLFLHPIITLITFFRTLKIVKTL